MATAKQIAFIESLISQTGDAGQNVVREHTLKINGQVEDLSTKQASSLISDLLDLPKVVKEEVKDYDRSITNKQRVFINSLLRGLGKSYAEETVVSVIGDWTIRSISKVQASALIDALIDLRDNGRKPVAHEVVEDLADEDIEDDIEEESFTEDSEDLATAKQVDTIFRLVCKGVHEEGGWFTGPTKLDEIKKMSRSSASLYIASLTDAA